MTRPRGLEPLTPGLGILCSIQPSFGARGASTLAAIGQGLTAVTNPLLPLAESAFKKTLDILFQNDHSAFMARTREFDPEEALDKAVQLFWRKGYFDTSMDDLVKETGVSRYGQSGRAAHRRWPRLARD